MKTQYIFMALALAIAALSPRAQAGFIQQVSGNTRPQEANGFGGTINFSVLDQTDATINDSWGTNNEQFNAAFVSGKDNNGQDSGALDTSAQYLYVYQFVNDGPKGIPASRVSIALDIDPSAITSWGYFNGLGFADDKDGTGTEVPVSVSNTFGIPGIPAEHASSSFGVNSPAVLSIADGTDAGMTPTGVYVLPKTFYADWGEANPVTKGRRTVIFGFTSNYGPGLDSGIIHQ
jgi:hypothetical protein